MFSAQWQVVSKRNHDQRLGESHGGGKCAQVGMQPVLVLASIAEAELSGSRVWSVNGHEHLTAVSPAERARGVEQARRALKGRHVQPR